MIPGAGRRSLVWVGNRLDEWFELPELARTVLAVAPAIVLFLLCGNVLALKAGLVCVWMLIVTERTQPSAMLLLAHAVAMAVSIGAFSAAFSHPLLFVPLCALCGATAQWTARWGKGWGAITLYCFLPALYVGCELNATADAFASFVELLRFSPIAIVPVAIVSFARMWKKEHMSAAVRLYCRMSNVLPRQGVKPANERTIIDSAAIRAIAVFAAAAIVKGFEIENGEWLIWSSASVSTGELASTHRKHCDRLWGALLGVPAGLAVSSFITPSPVVESVALLVVVISLHTFRSYRFAFFVRCLLSVVAAVAIGDHSTIGRLRFLNVVLGGLTGLVATYAYHSVRSRGSPT